MQMDWTIWLSVCISIYTRARIDVCILRLDCGLQHEVKVKLPVIQVKHTYKYFSFSFLLNFQYVRIAFILNHTHTEIR